ncbi:MAG: hypothetical protein DI564_07470 [Rhodanobacter denitrificans]|uniref:Uncharacterized protein n=1 Tax=Rhodanobacter denitrificans TaxID=666685 RepID=A0A2W5KHN9_9GAMM|nr:MAG: hypothetical protein DI564_07470 [Rhodanobacter denitrificans]
MPIALPTSSLLRASIGRCATQRVEFATTRASAGRMPSRAASRRTAFVATIADFEPRRPAASRSSLVPPTPHRPIPLVDRLHRPLGEVTDG